MEGAWFVSSDHPCEFSNGKENFKKMTMSVMNDVHPTPRLARMLPLAALPPSMMMLSLVKAP